MCVCRNTCVWACALWAGECMVSASISTTSAATVTATTGGRRWT